MNDGLRADRDGCGLYWRGTGEYFCTVFWIEERDHQSRLGFQAVGLEEDRATVRHPHRRRQQFAPRFHAKSVTNPVWEINF